MTCSEWPTPISGNNTQIVFHVSSIWTLVPRKRENQDSLRVLFYLIGFMFLVLSCPHTIKNFPYMLWNYILGVYQISSPEVFGGFRLTGPVQQFTTAWADSGSDKTSNAEVWFPYVQFLPIFHWHLSDNKSHPFEMFIAARRHRI